MARLEKTVVLDGHSYTMKQLGALEGRRLWLKIFKVMAGPLRSLSEADAADNKTVAQILAGIIENLDDGTTEEMYEAFGRSCTVKVGERSPSLEGVIFDEHFAGEYVRMSKWLGENIVFNFASFLGDGALGKISALATKAVSRSTSQKDSTGGSSESSPTSEPQ